MPKTRLHPPLSKSRFTRRVRLNAFVCLYTVLALACSGDRGLAPLPPGDGPLTGKWIQPSVDTWIQLELSQSGSRVVGYYRTGSANFGGSLSDPISVTGIAALPNVTLEWNEGHTLRTMNATLSADGNTLTGTWNLADQPATPFRGFNRATQ